MKKGDRRREEGRPEEDREWNYGGALVRAGDETGKREKGDLIIRQ
jgi:hypothetical protein